MAGVWAAVEGMRRCCVCGCELGHVARRHFLKTPVPGRLLEWQRDRGEDPG